MNIRHPQKVLPIWIIAVITLGTSSSACTYGPKENRVEIEQVVRPGDSYTAYVLVQIEEFRKPTGINTFPNGGVPWILNQKVDVYKIQARNRKARLLAELPADKSTWVSFSGHITGFDRQNTPYLQLAGCPKGGECYPGLYNFRYFHIRADETIEPVPEIPSNIKLPGTMLARKPGEANYVRFSIRHDTLRALFREGGNYEPLFTLDLDGKFLTVN